MKQAIKTKYLPATNHRGSRITARSESGHRLTVGWDGVLGVEDNHIAAARALAKKLQWHGQWFGGGYDNGYVFVLGCGPDFTVKGDVQK